MHESTCHNLHSNVQMRKGTRLVMFLWRVKRTVGGPSGIANSSTVVSQIPDKLGLVIEISPPPQTNPEVVLYLEE